MLWQWSATVIAELTAVATLLLLTIYYPRADNNRQAQLTGTTLTFACALWMLSHALEIGLPVASYKVLLMGIQLAMGTISITCWLAYILHYLGPTRLHISRLYGLFATVPLMVIVAVSTNDFHGLMWTGSGMDSLNPYLPLHPDYGMLHWAFMAYVSFLMLTGSYLIISSIIRHRYRFSREAVCLLVAAVLPLATAFVEVMGLLEAFRLSVGFSPWAACIGATIVTLNLPRFRPEQIIPVARDITFERISDCIFVLDVQNRVLDLNPAAEQLIGSSVSAAFGLPIERIWQDYSVSMTQFSEMIESSEEFVLGDNGRQKTYYPSISTINDSEGRLTGQVILLTDITERKQMEEDLRESAERIREYAAHLEKAREDERTGIARELHDQLGQALTAIRMDLTSMQERLVKECVVDPCKVDTLIRLVDATTDDVRRISSELRPGILDDLGLAAAMEWQLQQFQERTGIRAELAPLDSPVLSKDRATALYRIFQELLTNVARHAAASTVSVEFARDDSHYLLTVSDDGRGMAASTAEGPTSLGFVGIRERLAPFAGTLTIAGVKGQGTRVTITIPLDRRAPGDDHADRRKHNTTD